MDQKTIKAAAKKHAMEQLGKEQFDNNVAAVQAISEDFIAGVAWLKKLSNKDVPETGYYFLTRSCNMAKNKLQEAMVEASKTWNKVLIRSNPDAILQQLTDLVDELNAQHPRCAPLRVGHFNYEKFEPAFYIKYGTDDTVVSLVLSKVGGEHTGLQKGGFVS